jgi:hypothetical protein
MTYSHSSGTFDPSGSSDTIGPLSYYTGEENESPMSSAIKSITLHHMCNLNPQSNDEIYPLD